MRIPSLQQVSLSLLQRISYGLWMWRQSAVLLRFNVHFIFLHRRCGISLCQQALSLLLARIIDGIDAP
ncbi:hypothetical protein KCP75_24755 [Salmonella enterica subsp. enterica]|nr:hypothetical protein KCP75_24755 [Salmonella enterica subsp. enterica]